MSKKVARKLKVLIVIYKLAVGGAERVACSLATTLNRNRFEPVFCAFKGGRLEDELKEEGVKVYTLQKSGRHDFSVLFKLMEIIRNEKIDIIHTHSFSANMWGRIAGAAAGAPVIITTEHTVAGGKTMVQKMLNRVLERFCARTVAVSETVRRSLLEQEGLSPEKVITIHNGIEFIHPVMDDGAFSKLAAELGIDTALPVVTVIGRLEPPKGHAHLLNAFKTIVRKGCASQLLLVGDGRLRGDLETLAGELGISDNVIFAGHRSDIGNILQLTDVAVLSSVREGFSITLLEYMASSLPIVATDVGGNREAIGDGCGIIVPPAEPEALADAIMRLINDSNMAVKMGKRAGDRFKERFNIKTMVKRVELLYEHLYSCCHVNSSPCEAV